MELERQIKLTKATKATKSEDKPIESPKTSIAIPPKKKLIGENSAIIRRIKEAEEKANLEKLSDEELIEREFREQAEAIRAMDMNSNAEYMEHNITPQTRNMSDLELEDGFIAQENFDDSLTRAPLPQKNSLDSLETRNSTEKTARKSPLDDRVDLSDLMPNPPRTTPQKAPKKGSLGLIDTRNMRESSNRNAQQINSDSRDNVTHLGQSTRDSQNSHYLHDSRLDSMKDFLKESGDNHTTNIIDDIAKQNDSNPIVGIYTPDPRDFDDEPHHSVEFVDKIDSYDIEIPKTKAFYAEILDSEKIIDNTDDIDTLNEINASLIRAQKRLEEKLKVAKIRQKLGDIKSVTPIDSDNFSEKSPKNAVDSDESNESSDEIFMDFSQKSNADLAHIPRELHKDLPKTTQKIDLSDLILDKDSTSNKSAQIRSESSSNQPRFNSESISNPPQINRDFATNSPANQGITTRNEMFARQNSENTTKKDDEFGENFFDLEPSNLTPQSPTPPTNLSANPNSTSDFQLPPLNLLNPPLSQKIDIDDSEIDIKVQNLFNKLRVFKIEGDIVRTYSGPVVTTFEFRPAANVKVSRIQNLQDDLSMALKATSIRIQAPIPGKDVVGIEIPNNKIQTIYLREIFESEEFRNSNANLPIALGKDVIGNPVIEDLATLPHLLIAGTTGSGKSVGINAMILSLLYKHTPKELRFIMIDPKFLEFGLYKDIPHLLTPIITDPKKAIIALSKAVEEMNRRYELMDKAKVKTIVGFNELAKKNGEEKLPYIVIIIDEFADLMIMGGREAEQFLISLAGKARASGIHLIIATQRPTVNVVTGLIKGNLPSKISYRVGSKIDSKVILDDTGAEALLGRGDMLFSKTNNIVRLHAPYNDEREIERIVDFLKSQQQEVQYDEFFSLEQKEPTAPPPTQLSGEGDLKERAKEIILQSGKTSISYVQRKLGVGYNKSADIVEALEKDGFLSPPNYKGVREIIGS